MATLNLQVAASENDAFEAESGGIMDIANDDVSTISSSNVALRSWGAFRFPVTQLVKGDHIVSCVLQAYISGTLTDDANFDIYFEKVASPAIFTTTLSDITDRTRTTALVAWVEDSLGIGWASSDDLTAVLQEVLDLFTPDAIVIILKPNTDVTKNFSPRAYDFSDGTLAAKLDIEYIGQAETNPTRGVAAIIAAVPPVASAVKQREI